MSFVNNFVGFTKKSSVLGLCKSETYNMYLQTEDANEHAYKFVLLPMPGYEQVGSETTLGTPRGMYKVNRGINGKPAIYGVWDNTLYLIEGTTKTAILTCLVNTSRCTFAETGGYGENHPHLVICDGTAVYCIDTTLGVGEQGTTAKRILMPRVYNSPSTSEERIIPAWIAQCWNHLVVGEKDSDIFYHSIQYPFETRTSTGQVDYDVFEANVTNPDTAGYGHWNMSEWQPDNTVTGCATASYLYTFGVKSYQVFQYNQSHTLPFTCPQGSAGNIGIRSAESLAVNGNQVYWLGSADMGVGSVYSCIGNQVQKISTKEIEDIIKKCAMETSRAFVMKWDNHEFYVITFTGDGVTLAYDINEKGWITLGSRTNSLEEGAYRYINSIVTEDGDTLMQCNGSLVKASNETWFEHDNTPIYRKRVGGVISSDHMPMKVSKIQLMTNCGQYSNINTYATCTMRYSPDTITWSPLGTYYIGANGDYDYDVVFRDFMKCKRLSLEVGSSDNIPFSLYGIDIKGVTCKV